MQSTDNLIIQNMDIDDLKSAIAWAGKEGWNPISHAAEAYYALDPHGYFLLRDQKHTIATISKVKYKQGLAFIGFYIVDPAYRGQGYGKYLWDAIVKDLNKDAYVALDGVVAQISNYQTSGFELYTTTSRYYQHVNCLLQIYEISPTHVTFCDEVAMEDLIAYDQSVFSQAREGFLMHLLKLPDAKRLIAHDKKRICGYGQILKAKDGYRISPLFADDFDIAAYIFNHLCQTVKENLPIYIDIPDNHKDAKAFVELFQLEKSFETARMYYHNKQPKRLEHKEFGRTTLELG